MELKTPFAIPEIQLLISGYLERDDLVHCLRVCKAWHKLLVPLVWKHAETGQTSIECWSTFHTPIEDMERHRNLITTLTILEVLPCYYTLHCPNLQSLKIYLDGVSNRKTSYLLSEDPVPATDPTNMIQLNTTLKELKLYGRHGELRQSFWRAISKLPQLKRLMLHTMTVSKHGVNYLWKTCKQLEVLEMPETTFNTTGSLASNTYPHIRKLGLSYVYELSQVNQLELISRCPQLEDLEWICESKEMEAASVHFARRAGEGFLTNVKVLRHGHHTKDEHLAQIVGAIQSVRTLGLGVTEAGNKTFQSLGRHFNTLVELDLHRCEMLTSPMICQLLCSCGALERITATSVSAKDVVEGGQWVCLSMRSLTLQFEFGQDEQDLQPLVYERLSKLTQLRLFNFRIDFSLQKQEYPSSLDLRLQSGLATLANLKKLEYVNFENTWQELSPVEIEWILTNWKRLKTITGPFDHRYRESSKLAEMFHPHDIFPQHIGMP